MNYPRTHERLARESTRDPIFLLQERRTVWHEGICPDATYDHEAEGFVDGEGEELTTEQAIEAGAGVWTWNTIGVFLTREEGEEWASARSYRYHDGWRVYCIPVDGGLVDVLAAATEGGRYS